MEKETALWLAERRIETELRDGDLVAWIPPEHLADFYDIVHGENYAESIPGEIMPGGDFYVNLSGLII